MAALGSGLEAAEFDLAFTPLRELNAALHAVDDSSRALAVLNPAGHTARSRGQRARGRRDRRPRRLLLRRHEPKAKVTVHGNAGLGVAENIMSGTVIVEGNASQSAGAPGAAVCS